MFKRDFASAVILLVCLGALHSGLTQAAERSPDAAASAPTATPDATKDQKLGTATQGKAQPNCVSDEVVLIDPDTEKRFRDHVRLRLSGYCVDAFRAAAQKVGSSRAPSLYLDGVEMKGLSATAALSAPKIIDLSFSLTRDSQQEDNRKSWDNLLSRQRLGSPMKLPIALGIDAGPAVVAAGDKSLIFTTVQRGEGLVWSVVIVGVIALVLSFWILLKGNALRDSWGGAYSLGKSQMAFWGLIVFLSFLGVWLITGSMERIPPQTLVLLGISGVTGLAAVLIGNTKDAPAVATAKLDVEQDALVAKGTGATPQESQRLIKIDQDLVAIAAYAVQRHVSLKDFFRDICDDGTGASFHRVQVVIWTVLLGAVFVWSVVEVISMPEFPPTLLLLLGISNGTYLGFKFPEKV